MAQDPAGYLWLGTSEGLIRFDGHQFTAWAETGGPSLPGTAISALIAARDGSLWVGFSDARGVARLQGGELNVHAGEMLPRRPVTLLLEDSSGAIWAGGTDGMSVLENGRWRTVGANEGLVDSEVSGLYEDRKGGLWVGTSVGVFHRPVATAAFFLHTAASKFVQSFAEDAAGHIWMTDMERMLRRLDGGVEPEFADDVPLPGGGWRLFTDARGNLWVSALGNGLFRIDHRSLLSRPRVERLKYEHKFAGSGPGGARAIFHDRDHNIWVSTRASGLLRIRESFVNSNVPLPGLTFDGVRALTATPDGNVWIATFFNLLRTDREGMQEYDFARTMALHASHDGELWAATGSGIGRVNEGRLIAEPVPATLRLERISSLALAPDRALWICSVEQGVFRWASGRLEHFSKEPLAAQPCGVVHAGRDGRIWIGFTRGGLAIYANGEFRQVTPRDGLAPGGVAVMYEDSRRRLWIATANGVSRVDGDRFVTVTDKNGLPRRIVPSFVEDQQGYIWLGVQAGSGVIRFHPDDFDAAAAAPGGQLRYTLYDETDGLIGPLFRSSRPSAVRGGDGRIWLASGNSIATLDPARVPGESPAPLPTIERVVIDGRDVPPTSNLVLPPHTATVRVHYSALDLTRASKLRFRYRLEGFDQGWIDAGQSREAQYANLRPGDYRLRIATTGDGAWHADETVWAFSVQPPFYEARWFIASCVFAFLLLISAVWWARVRMIRKEFVLVVGERARVSRDLHDTLLQSLAAVGMELEVLASHADAGAGHPLSSSLRALRRQVGRCVVEARRSTSELRSPRLEVRDLVDDLRQFADDVSLGTAVQVDVVVSGRSRRSTPETDEQLLKIGQEAIANAVRHSGSDLVRVELVYTRRTVMLRVSDTGSGFEVDAARSGEHWGIRNMHDRATRISAQFTVTSAPGQGTTVETIVVR
jgi:signal transduction histidine kinase/ligand-binding sensor domain-containing protein